MKNPTREEASSPTRVPTHTWGKTPLYINQDKMLSTGVLGELVEFLVDPIGQRLFGKYAAKEGKQELLLCWVDIEQYKSLDSLALRDALARKIVNSDSFRALLETPEIDDIIVS